MSDTIQSRIAAIMLAIGWQQSTTPKRIVFRNPDLTAKAVYLGKRGSIRVGETVTASRSFNYNSLRNWLRFHYERRGLKVPFELRD